MLPLYRVLFHHEHELSYLSHIHVHADRVLYFSLSIYVLSYFVYVSREGYGESTHLHRLDLTFSARQCDKYQNRICKRKSLLINLSVMAIQLHLPIQKNLCKTADLKKMVYKTKYRLMQVKSLAECSNGSIMQYF